MHSPVRCLLQIESASYVLQEAAEFARNYGSGLTEAQAKLWAFCDERVIIGGENSPVFQDANRVTAVEGFAVSSFDPGSEQSVHLLRAVARFANGILWDKLNGTAWAPDHG